MSSQPLSTHNLISRDSEDFLNGFWRNTKSYDAGFRFGCQFQMQNNLTVPIMFSWIDGTGDICNSTSVPPNGGYKQSTYIGDAFVASIHPSDGIPTPRSVHEILEDWFLFAYIPLHPNFNHWVTLNYVASHNLRGSLHSISEIKCCHKLSPLTYKAVNRSGFSIYLEETLLERIPAFLNIITADLCAVEKLLPNVACSLLQDSTPIFFNNSVRLDTENRANGMFHDVAGEQYLISQHMPTSHAGCVEFCSGAIYMKDRPLW
jgi:hypothetical protein